MHACECMESARDISLNLCREEGRDGEKEGGREGERERELRREGGRI